MLTRVKVTLKDHVTDAVGRKTAQAIRDFLDIGVDRVRTVKVFTLDGVSQDTAQTIIDRAALHDPVLQDASLDPVTGDFSWALEKGFRPGVTDNEGRTARETVALVAGLSPEQAESLSVYTATQYLIDGDLDRDAVERIGRDLLANELIERISVKSGEEWKESPGFEAQAAKVVAQAVDEVGLIDIAAMDDDALMKFSRDNVLALSLEEMHGIQAYYADPVVKAAREKAGVSAIPTDAELECLAQTWSEHCKHKIFTARINYENKETGRSEQVDSLFSTYIQGSTATIRERLGEDDFCLSVFKDNAGVIRFSDELSVCVKVETHNSPSALDPYGGALTGIVGVNRDPMGTGLGADMLCNTDVFCFASPFWQGELPPRLLHPRRVLEGVREGVEHGGNKSGIPTVNGSLVFDERYLGKPLVYCGTVGTMPVEVAGRPSHEKFIDPGDVIVMAGGRIGKDGIHGATFSSEELHEGSPATAVQIGDPITQRKMYDFIIRARDAGLYNAITDNGAGGLSSSVGEMAEFSGGAHMDLAKAPVKYDGLRPWEILVSEAQERMSLAVPPAKLDEFLALAKEMDVEATPLGTFTDSGYFHVTYGDTPVAYLDMDFLHEGVPQMELEAVWERPVIEDSGPVRVEDQGALLKDMLGRLNICSKEYVVRQYDHEVKGSSAIKPLVGTLRDGPSDAGVLRPDLADSRGLVVSHGICPKFSDLDTYWMMANAIDEAVRNAVAVGGNPSHMAGVDNFCWCDPVQSEKTPDGRYKLAQLVRANQALAHFCLAFGVPCVSGKDSMKNDYTGGGQKISIPPTVLYTVIALVDDVAKAVTSDAKYPGELLYVLGLTQRELGGSELSDQLGLSFNQVPQVDAMAAKERYLALHEAMNQGLVTACHDLSDGGLGVALAEMAIGGRVGLDFNLDLVPSLGCQSAAEILYSESASRFLVTIAPENQARFEALFVGKACSLVGSVRNDDLVIVTRGGEQLINEPVQELVQAWQTTLDW
ncbi:MAG: phosphoribosylformylglycinamidine synthase [Desulfovibrio sp.]|mgnify:CR=1 FL=1|nr:MAG: phosphoribosylformylglycinamidine synthase [Desulfovibrio sp.]